MTRPMFMPFAFLLLLASVPLTGGRLSRLAGLRVHATGSIVVALGLQVLMTTVVPDAPHALLIALHGASYAVIARALWLNRRLPGLLLIAAGGGTNAAVIALNGGTLPARPEALADAGFTVDPEAFKNSGVVEDPVLPWLGDITATPGWLPFQNVISLGDVAVLVGAAVLLHVSCRRPSAAPTPSPSRVTAEVTTEVTAEVTAEVARPAVAAAAEGHRG